MTTEAQKHTEEPKPCPACGELTTKFNNSSTITVRNKLWSDLAEAWQPRAESGLVKKLVEALEQIKRIADSPNGNLAPLGSIHDIAHEALARPTGQVVNAEEQPLDYSKPSGMAYRHLSDKEMADKVRMLMRGDLDHEAVCVGARDRIMHLSKVIDILRLPSRELSEAAFSHDDQPSPRVFLQWKGTDACFDFHCKCGAHCHFDGYFAYHVKCPHCSTIYQMPFNLFPREVKSVSPDGCDPVLLEPDEEMGLASSPDDDRSPKGGAL